MNRGDSFLRHLRDLALVAPPPPPRYENQPGHLIGRGDVTGGPPLTRQYMNQTDVSQLPPPPPIQSGAGDPMYAPSSPPTMGTPLPSVPVPGGDAIYGGGPLTVD